MKTNFNYDLAVKFGVNESLFIEHLRCLTYDDLLTKSNFNNNLYWFQISIKSFQSLFPFWSKKQIETIISSCIRNGLIAKENQTKNSYNRTCWYALTESARLYYPELNSAINNDKQSFLIKDKCIDGEMHECIVQKWEMDEIKNIDVNSNNYTKNITIHQKLNAFDENSDSLMYNIYNINNINNNKKEKLKKKKEEFGISDMILDNPHGIPETLLTDWIQVRKVKRAAITKTAWTMINRVLSEIKNKKNIDPLSAFETMVSSGWISLKPEWLDTNRFQKNNRNLDTSWINDINKPFHEITV